MKEKKKQRSVYLGALNSANSRALTKDNPIIFLFMFFCDHLSLKIYHLVDCSSLQRIVKNHAHIGEQLSSFPIFISMQHQMSGQCRNTDFKK